ncbi:type IV pilus modification protein PilV [Marinobacter mobilis]
MRQQQGSSLIEILVAVLIFAIGLLGVAGMQVYSLKMNANSHIRTQANLLAQDMVERMRSNPFQRGAYAMSFSECTTAVTGNPSSADIAASDRRNWCRQLDRNLPAGQGSVDVDNGLVTITVRWQERAGREQVDGNGNGTGSEQSSHQFVIRARLDNA